jgi:hypothetical protein
MERIKDFFSTIWDYISELSEWWWILIFGLVSLAVVECGTSFLGDTYTKLYPNNNSYTLAKKEFKKICGYKKYSIEDEVGGVVYSQTYNVEEKAKGDFFALVYSLDEIYANGKFRHYYLFGDEKIYQCCDKDRRLIAVRLREYEERGEDDFYEIEMFIENKRED